MRGMFNRILALTALFFLFILPVTAAETYTIDPMHSVIEWHVSHFGFSSPSGKWYVNGTLQLDESKPQNSKADVTIQVEDVITGIPKLDKHLKTDEFFDVKKYPTATFVSNKVTVTGKNTAKVQGILTLHGVSKPVMLDVTLNKLENHPITEKKTAGFTAKTTLKRSNFGMNTFLPGVGDKVKIDIEIEANKAS